MAEPSASTFVVTGIVAAALGPVFGPVVLIVFGAVAGSMLAMGKAVTSTRWEGFRFVMVGVMLALAITGGAAWMLDHFFQIPSNVALMPIAALIGAVRNTLLSVMEKIVELLVTLLGSLIRSKGGQ